MPYFKYILLFSFLFSISHSATVLASSLELTKSLRISNIELLEKQKTSNLIILDARNAEQYQKGHIPDALNFPAEKTYHSDQNGLIIQPIKMQAILRSLGIDTHKNISYTMMVSYSTQHAFFGV